MTTAFITIDGSSGEGGGQILRTSLALAALTGTPLRMENIRAGRAKPGLMRQHMVAVEAARRATDGYVEGAAVGASSITFEPGPVRGGVLELDIGSAGSTTLVLQTVLPCLLAAAEPSRLVLRGGTHNPMCPTIDYLTGAFLPVLRAMGAAVEVELVRPGFAPAGGGELAVTVTPGPLRPLSLMTRGALRSVEVVATIAGLAEHIAYREATVASQRLEAHGARWRIQRHPDAHGPGNALTIIVASDHVTDVFTAIGRRGVRAEAVAAEAADAAREYLAVDAPVGPHLADQLLLPMALAGGGEYVTTAPTLHTRTQIETIRRFLPLPIACAPIDGGRFHIALGSSLASGRDGSGRAPAPQGA
ncbi:MAG: RNA 3'-terminal phosphate cyclase [Myxococcota bacterium]